MSNSPSTQLCILYIHNYEYVQMMYLQVVNILLENQFSFTAKF